MGEMDVTAGGVSLGVHERLPDDGLRGSVLLLSGPMTTGTSFHIPIDGFDAATRLAATGRASWSVDYVGTGRSTIPVDGAAVSPHDSLGALEIALEQMRERHGVDRIDIVAESIGGGLATVLARSPLVRSVVISTVMFETLSPLAQMMFCSDDFAALLASFDDGYFVVGPEFFAGAMADAEPSVADWLSGTQCGRYPVGFLSLPLKGLPWFDPSGAVAPGLVLVGPGDPVPGPGDAAALARAYGARGAVYEELADGGHVLRLQPRTISDRYWARVIDWLDDPHDGNTISGGAG